MLLYEKKFCDLCKDRKECYTTKYGKKYCLRCVMKNDWMFRSLIRDDRRKIRNLLEQRKKERREVELEEEIIKLENNYDTYYSQIENVKKIKEKIRYCKFCNKEKMTQYKIDETKHDKEYNRKTIYHTHAICNSCLEFIAGMDNMAKWNNNPPPKNNTLMAE